MKDKEKQDESVKQLEKVKESTRDQKLIDKIEQKVNSVTKPFNK
jgi:hypothetical protein